MIRQNEQMKYMKKPHSGFYGIVGKGDRQKVLKTV